MNRKICSHGTEAPRFTGPVRIAAGAASIALLLATGVAAQTKPPANAPAAGVNAFQDQAAKLGVRRCTNVFAALGQSASGGASYAVQVMANRAAPDAHTVAGAAGMTYQIPEYSGPAVSVVSAAPVGQGCEGQMVRVTPFQKSCQDVVKLFPGGSTVAANLSGVPVYNLGGNQGQAMLLANGNGCVVVTIAFSGAAAS